MDRQRNNVVAKRRAQQPVARIARSVTSARPRIKVSDDLIAELQNELMRLAARLVARPPVMILIVSASVLTFFAVLGIPDPYADIVANVKDAGYAELANKMTTFKKRAIGLLWAAAAVAAADRSHKTVIGFMMLAAIFLLKARAAIEYAVLAGGCYVYFGIRDLRVRVAVVIVALVSLYASRP